MQIEEHSEFGVTSIVCTKPSRGNSTRGDIVRILQGRNLESSH
jgi:hypothetical protein